MSGSDPLTGSKVVILDFGSQYTQVIARRVRESRVYSEILPYNCSGERLAASGAAGIILSGGPASVFSESAPQVDPAIFEQGLPVLGICYGLQLMAFHLGGRVEFSSRREYGAGRLIVVGTKPSFRGSSGAIPGLEQPWRQSRGASARFCVDRTNGEFALRRCT